MSCELKSFQTHFLIPSNELFWLATAISHFAFIPLPPQVTLEKLLLKIPPSLFQTGKEDESGGCLLDIWSPLRDFQEGKKELTFLFHTYLGLMCVFSFN